MLDWLWKLSSQGVRVPALVDGPRRYRPELVADYTVVGISRNGWSLCAGISGRFAPESVVAFGRIAHDVQVLAQGRFNPVQT